jgi:hypothetical protein
MIYDHDTFATVEVPKHELEAMYQVFGVKEYVAGFALAEALAQNLVDRYFSPAYWSQEDMDQIVDDILAEREV